MNLNPDSSQKTVKCIYKSNKWSLNDSNNIIKKKKKKKFTLLHKFQNLKAVEILS